jgi:transcriptional regulator with PAS, ATPase and Fis domain
VAEVLTSVAYRAKVAHMTTRKTLSADVILVALRASKEDVESAATLLGVTERTLQRRMAELNIRARIRYEVAEAA